jgi:hypothetical protein
MARVNTRQLMQIFGLAGICGEGTCPRRPVRARAK